MVLRAEVSSGFVRLRPPPSAMREPPKPPLTVRLKALLETYGPVALGTYFTIFGLVLAGFAVAIHMGVRVESAEGTLGTLGAAYVATKLTQPLRILATLVLTPVLAKLFVRKRTDSPS